MKAKILRIALIFVCVSLLFSFTVGVSAADDKKQKEWSISEDGETLSDGAKSYTQYYLNVGYYSERTNYCVFEGTVYYDGEMMTIVGDSAEPNLVWLLDSEGYFYLFVDDVGEKIVDDLVYNRSRVYHLEDGNDNYSTMDKELFDALNASSEKYAAAKIVDVRTLAKAEMYEIAVRDTTLNLGLRHGAIYKLDDGRYYYLNFEALTNEYFDSEGYFSYRSGSVTVYRISEETSEKLSGAISSMVGKKHTSFYEKDYVNGRVDAHGAPLDKTDSELIGKIVFWIVHVLGGFLLPIGLIGLSAIMICLKKSFKLFWRIMAIVGAVWLCSAISITLIILI
ncbi:MAG: hypothetical protein E7641_07350 [Ruminococcaceae bacterium]|nr:hypothetical protein [Oscillospiraceae bacterium]